MKIHNHPAGESYGFGVFLPLMLFGLFALILALAYFGGPDDTEIQARARCEAAGYDWIRQYNPNRRFTESGCYQKVSP